VTFRDSYKGGKKLFAFFANNSYLAKAGNSPESPEVVRKVFNYFRKNTLVLWENQEIKVLDWKTDEKTTKFINRFLSKIDLGIEKFTFEKNEQIQNFSFPKTMPEELVNKIKEEHEMKESFYHKDDKGELVAFDNKLESSGTLRVFNMLPLFLNVLTKGELLFIDEIENSLHPHIAELIIKLFNDPIINKKNAQLIFTTHDLSLMSQGVMRKDQINLVEKSAESGTSLSTLEDFDLALKDSSPFAKWYDDGRLGAIPSINYREISDSIKECF
jgi:AAA15 family ATPase/GTPase